MTGLVLHAEDAPPATDGDGYRNITAKSGGPTILRVKDQPNPYRNVAAHTTSEKYSPMSLDFSRTSPMANKPFTTGDAGLSKKNDEERNFITKPYLGDGATTAPMPWPTSHTRRIQSRPPRATITACPA